MEKNITQGLSLQQNTGGQVLTLALKKVKERARSLIYD